MKRINLQKWLPKIKKMADVVVSKEYGKECVGENELRKLDGGIDMNTLFDYPTIETIIATNTTASITTTTLQQQQHYKCRQ